MKELLSMKVEFFDQVFHGTDVLIGFAYLMLIFLLLIGVLFRFLKERLRIFRFSKINELNVKNNTEQIFPNFKKMNHKISKSTKIILKKTDNDKKENLAIAYYECDVCLGKIMITEKKLFVNE